MKFKRVKIITTVPHKDADAIRDALGKAGSGQIGEYSFCSFSITGKGRFVPTEEERLQPQDKNITNAKWLNPNIVTSQLIHEKDKKFYEAALFKIRHLL